MPPVSFDDLGKCKNADRIWLIALWILSGAATPVTATRRFRRWFRRRPDWIRWIIAAAAAIVIVAMIVGVIVTCDD